MLEQITDFISLCYMCSVMIAEQARLLASVCRETLHFLNWKQFSRDASVSVVVAASGS